MMYLNHTMIYFKLVNSSEIYSIHINHDSYLEHMLLQCYCKIYLQSAQSSDEVIATCLKEDLTHLFPMDPFSTPGKYKNTIRFSDVFRG